ncbi:uncharacterized protein LOC134271151 [Saccostrea cucullata]|uniref:uncharacterized protein LOC134271151 n=1 Tax=Saccostrea cuccullata TaxID=36930 RepID=UPI002ED5EFC2
MKMSCLNLSLSPLHQRQNKISIAYPSGTRKELVRNEQEKKICRAIVQERSSGKAAKSIISILRETNKEDIVNAASLIIANESKGLCRKNSGSILQRKDNESILEFSWDMFHKELQLRAPSILQVLTSAVCDVPVKVEGKKFAHILHSVASVLHGRSAEMSSLHYQIAFILAHGGCTQRDIDRLAKCGITVTSKSIHNKLASWKGDLDKSILKLKEDWEQGREGCLKYQIVGDNWDKKILPSFR